MGFLFRGFLLYRFLVYRFLIREFLVRGLTGLWIFWPLDLIDLVNLADRVYPSAWAS